jgi:isocitrate dehydrogenase (NAD+)
LQKQKYDSGANIIVLHIEYSGFEQEVEPGVVQSLKIVTELASRRICEYAFQLAASEGRKKVTAVHKANIQ